MHNSAKLLPILLLGSTLGACSMADTGGYYGDQHTQANQGYYQGGNAGCGYNYTVCRDTYPVAQSSVATQSYGGQAGVVSPYSVGQNSTQSYGTRLHAAQPYLDTAPAYPAYQGQNSFPPAYVGSQNASSNGLRKSYTYGTLGATLYDVDSELYGIQGRLGWQSESVFGVEVEGSYGFNEDAATVDFGAGPVAAESGIETQIAGFGVLRYPVSNRANILTRLGYHSTEFEANFDDGTTVLEQDFSTDGLAYGIGIEYALSHNTALRADYTRYDFDGPEADSVSLAIARKF